MISVVGKFGLPTDAVAGGAGIAAIALWLLRHRFERAFARWHETRGPTLIRLCAVCAALASVGYFYFYLRGGPRIIDATYYWLQAKTFASGHFTLPLLHPTAAERGRFLYFDAAREQLSVLFPPGYAAILALGMLLKAPQFVGPCIAAGLVLATAALARRIFESTRVAVVAALLSVICAALRFHTAETMSHGWAALLFATTLWAVLGLRRWNWTIAGLCAGWLLATRPFTALALLAVVVLALRSSTLNRAPWLLLGMFPGVALWLAYQRVTTGDWLSSTQLAYYAVADGPPGCFRYGFGAGIGCQFEHGDYVRKRLPEGYTLASALAVSGVRLRWHLLDILNFEPLALVLLAAAKAAWKRPSSRALLAAPLLLLLAYAPFYFDGNFPGGGARLLADVIPLEHVLIASWVAGGARLAPTVALSLLGFALHASPEHRQLQQREGGRPMFEPAVVASAGIQHGLLFVDTDHGFALGHDPAVRDAGSGLVVAREHFDDHDRLLWEQLGRPPAYRYKFPFTREQAHPIIEPVTFVDNRAWRFELEAEWPVLAVHDAWVVPGFPPTGCVSGQRALIVHPSGPSPAIELALPVPQSGKYRMRLGWVAYDEKPMNVEIAVCSNPWIVRTAQSRFDCGSALGPSIELEQGEARVRLQLERSSLALDWIELIPTGLSAEH